MDLDVADEHLLNVENALKRLQEYNAMSKEIQKNSEILLDLNEQDAIKKEINWNSEMIIDFKKLQEYNAIQKEIQRNSEMLMDYISLKIRPPLQIVAEQQNLHVKWLSENDYSTKDNLDVKRLSERDYQSITLENRSKQSRIRICKQFEQFLLEKRNEGKQESEWHEEFLSKFKGQRKRVQAAINWRSKLLQLPQIKIKRVENQRPKMKIGGQNIKQQSKISIQVHLV